MRPLNITDRKAGKQIGHVTTYTKRGSIAGTMGTGGGMSTTTSGAPTVIGTIGIMIEMTADKQGNRGRFEATHISFLRVTLLPRPSAW
jgi:hypothetical protein